MFLWLVPLYDRDMTDILDVQGISADIVRIYRQLWGDLSLEDVQAVYEADGLDKIQELE